MSDLWNIDAPAARDRFEGPSSLPHSGLSRLTYRVRDVFATSTRSGQSVVSTGLPLPPRDGDKSSRRASIATSVFPRPKSPTRARHSSVPVPPPSVFDSTFPTAGSSTAVATRIVTQSPRTDSERIKDEWRARQRAAQVSLAADPRRTSPPPFVGIKRVPSPRVPSHLLEASQTDKSTTKTFTLCEVTQTDERDNASSKAGIEDASPAPNTSQNGRYQLPSELFPPAYLLSSAALDRQPSISGHCRVHSDASDDCPPSLVSCNSSTSQSASRPPITPVRPTFDRVDPVRIVIDSPKETSQAEVLSPFPTMMPRYKKVEVVLSPPPRPTRSPKRMSVGV